MRSKSLLAVLITVVTGLMSVSAFGADLSADLAAYLKTVPSDQKIRILIRPTGGVDGSALKKDVATIYYRRADQHREALLTLQNVAAQSQAKLLPVLGQMQLAETAENIKTYWIDNFISLDATPMGIRELAAREDIEKIYLFPDITMIKPGGNLALSKPGATRAEVGLRAIGADVMWAAGYTGKGRLIGSVDSGVDGGHPALAPKWRGNNGYSKAESWFDPIGGDSIPHTYGSPTGTNDEIARYVHGTITTGILVGHNPATGDTTGVAFDAQWISAAAMDVPGADIFEGLQWMIDPDGDPNTEEDVPDVISNSWGYPTVSGAIPPVDCDDLFWNTIDNLEAAGAVVIWAAGNEGWDGQDVVPQSIRNPANRTTSDVNAFAVGMVDAEYYPDSMFLVLNSSLGPGCDGQSPKPEVVAPGYKIRSTVPGGTFSSPVYFGTSFATPHVAGAVALLREFNPNATADTIKKVLLYSAIDLGPAGDDNYTGRGLINVPAALTLMPANTEPYLYIKSDSYTRPTPGGSTEITLTVRNSGIAVGNVAVELVPLDSRLTVTTGTASFGTFFANQAKDNSGNPFQVTVAAGVKVGERLPVQWRFTGSGYSRTTRGAIAVGPQSDLDVFTHDIGNVIFTISSFGQYGLEANGGNVWRDGSVGFYHPRTSTVPTLFEMGFLVGNGPDRVSDAVRQIGDLPSSDFLTDASGNLRVQQPGDRADQQTSAAFSDANAEHPLGLFIEQRSFAYVDTTDDDYVIMEYAIHNRSDSTLHGVRAALFADWDFPWGQNQGANDFGGFDSASGVGWMVNRATNAYRGIAALTPGKMVAYRYITNDPVLYDGFTEAEKWRFMNARFDSVSVVFSADGSQMMTIGGFDIQPNDSAIAAFAVIGAPRDRDMKTFARRAQQKYLCIQGQGTSVDLTADPATMSFVGEQGGPLPASQALAIVNYCGDTTWAISHSALWLAASPTSGRTPDTVTLSVTSIASPIGTYYDTLLVTSPGAADTARVSVSLQIAEGLPRLRISRTYVSIEDMQFQQPSAPETIWIINVGYAAMNWSAANDSVWLLPDPESGTIPAGDSTEVTLMIGAPGHHFVPGEYRDTVTITAPDAHDSPQQVAVNYRLLSGETTAHNEPNPFNPSDPVYPGTTIHLQLPERSSVEIKIYDLAGVLVKTLFAGWVNAGETLLPWDGHADGGPAVADGVYLCHIKLTAQDGQTQEQVLKMAVLKK